MAFLREDEKMKEIKIEKDKKRLQIRRDGHFYKTGNFLNRPKGCIPLIEFSYTSQTCGWKLIIYLSNIFAIHTEVQGTYFLLITNILDHFIHIHKCTVSLHTSKNRFSRSSGF